MVQIRCYAFKVFDLVLYKYCAAVACAVDTSSFAALALLPESSNCKEANGTTFQGRDGAILLFNAVDPVPVASWSARKV